ncbi:hypothetical protein QQZ08_011004 [Neonectria magnoliae]|uniref:JmjC domain-containing protein n=1 Tax=Neonectria magnoliae TaxID=2732573 RepID=A0ABR1HEV8_9HYPO
MFKPDPTFGQLDLLLSRQDKMEARLLAMENFVKKDRRFTRTVVRGGKQDHHDEPPAWAKTITDLLLGLLEDARDLKSETQEFKSQIIAAQSHNASNTRSELADASANERDSNPGEQDGNPGEQDSNPSNPEREEVSRASQPADESQTDGNHPEEDTLMTDGEPPTRGLVLEEDVAMVDSSEADATGQLQVGLPEGEGAAKLAVASDQPALPTTPDTNRQEDSTGNARTGVGSPPDDTMSQSQFVSAAQSPDASVQASGSPSKITLLASDMGERLVPALGEIAACNNTVNAFPVPPVNINLAELQASIDADDEGWQSTSIAYKAGPRDEGYARVYISQRKPPFDWSAFTQEVQRPTIEEAKAIFEDVAQNPPAGDIPYLIGHANIHFDNPLNPGPKVLEDPDLIDLHTEYHHIGANLSANRLHWEDMTTMDTTGASPEYYGFRSYNEVYFGPGYKLWLFIAMHHTPKFYDFANRNWKLDKCGQRLGHQCLLIAPSRLEKEGIDFRIEVVGCGQAIITKPGEIHAIVNHGPCVARSMNYLLPTDKLVAEKLTYCISSCGLIEVYEKYGATLVGPPKPLKSSRTPLVSGKPRKRKALEELPRTPSKTTRASTATTRRLNELEAEIRALDPLCNIPHIDPHDPDPNQLGVLKMVAWIHSSTAIRQFMDLVRGWRHCDVHMVISDNTEDDLRQQVNF